MDQSRPDETLRDFIERRERELMRQMQSFQNGLVATERELAELHRVRMMLNIAGPAVSPKPGETLSELDLIGRIEEHRMGCQRAVLFIQRANPKFLTIKQIIVRTFFEYLIDGATPAELGGCIRVNYGRDIGDTSIRPNLARLKRNGLLQADTGGKWTVDSTINQIFRRVRALRPDGNIDLLVWAEEAAWKEIDALKADQIRLQAAEEKLKRLTKDLDDKDFDD